MVYLILGAIIASFFLIITRDKDTFSSYPIRIETLSVAFSVFRLISARAVDRFSAVYSASVKSLI
jgi:hypothetical protein